MFFNIIIISRDTLTDTDQEHMFKMHTRTLPFLLSILLCVKISLCKSPSVIIVGTGPAGVAAATRLLENGYKNLTILEAENRVGGRVYSIFFGDAYIDIGAEWCHGEKGNIVYDLIKKYGILRHTQFGTDLHHSSKKNIDKQFAKELDNLMWDIYTPPDNKDEIKDITIGHYLMHKYNSTIYEKYVTDSEKLDIAKESVQYFHHVVLSVEGAFNWFDPSAENDYQRCEGDQNLNWNGLGYKTALEALIKKFPDPAKQLPFDEKVLLNKEVVKISWNESSTVSVFCSDNTVYEADYVIFTPSLGVLKEEHEKMFIPPLPIKKQEAIQRKGIGAVMKIALHFRKRWWDSDYNGSQFIWGENDTYEVSKELPEGPSKEGRSWVTEIFSVLPAERNPNVLIMWLTGDMIPQIELIDDEMMITGIVFTLNKFVGHKYNVTTPDSLMRSHWYTNPHFRGSYSFQTVESRKSNISAEVELSKPLLNLEGRPVVMFAGEATHPYFYSTVHGAIETGHREADRIINLYK